jgi:prepilin-type N-terminal cleavage/methylation domain-containing protein
MRSLSQARVDQRGFTLTELLVVIAIIGLIITGILTLLKKGNESYLAGANQVETQAATRATLGRMTQEIREAGYNPTGVVCVPPLGAGCAIVNTTPTSFTIQNDWNSSGTIQAGVVVALPYCFNPAPSCPPTPWTNVNRGEQITHTVDLAAGTLTRQESAVDAQPLVLLTSVQQAAVWSDCAGALIANPPIFQYCTASGGVAATPDQIRTVIVNIRAGVQNQPPGIWQAGAIQVTMTDRIRLRNRIP